MGTTTPTGEPQQGAQELFIKSPPQPYSKEIVKESAEPLPVRLLEMLTDIQVTAEKYPVSVNQAQMAEAYSATCALRTRFMIVLEEVPELPAHYRRRLFNTFATLVLLENELQFLIFLDKKLQELPQREGMLNDFKNNAVKYR